MHAWSHARRPSIYIYLLRVPEERRAVAGVEPPERDGGSGQRGGRLGGDVGAGGAGVHLVHGAGGVHVLRALPARVVLGGVANLYMMMEMEIN